MENQESQLVIVSDDQGWYLTGSGLGQLEEAKRFSPYEGLIEAAKAQSETGSGLRLFSVQSDAAADDLGAFVVAANSSWSSIDNAFRKEFGVEIDKEKYLSDISASASKSMNYDIDAMVKDGDFKSAFAFVEGEYQKLIDSHENIAADDFSSARADVYKIRNSVFNAYMDQYGDNPIDDLDSKSRILDSQAQSIEEGKLYSQELDSKIEIEKNASNKQLNNDDNATPKKTIEGELIENGHAKYNFDEKESDSYFVKLKGRQGGEFTIWGIGLADAMEGADFKQGDLLSLKNMGSKSVSVDKKIFDDNGNEVGVEKINAHRNEWQVNQIPEYSVSQPTIESVASGSINNEKAIDALWEEHIASELKNFSAKEITRVDQLEESIKSSIEDKYKSIDELKNDSSFFGKVAASLGVGQGSATAKLLKSEIEDLQHRLDEVSDVIRPKVISEYESFQSKLESSKDQWVKLNTAPMSKGAIDAIKSAIENNQSVELFNAAGKSLNGDDLSQVFKVVIDGRVLGRGDVDKMQDMLVPANDRYDYYVKDGANEIKCPNQVEAVKKFLELSAEKPDSKIEVVRRLSSETIASKQPNDEPKFSDAKGKFIAESILSNNPELLEKLLGSMDKSKKLYEGLQNTSQVKDLQSDCREALDFYKLATGAGIVTGSLDMFKQAHAHAKKMDEHGKKKQSPLKRNEKSLSL